MKRGQLAALIAILLLAALVALLALRSRQPPTMPWDEAHQRFESTPACLACHGPDGPLPRGRNHPLGAECTRCHGFGH